jgi:hypothetical protein
VAPSGRGLVCAASTLSYVFTGFALTIGIVSVGRHAGPAVRQVPPGRSLGPLSEFSAAGPRRSYFALDDGADWPDRRVENTDSRDEPSYRPCPFPIHAGNTARKARADHPLASATAVSLERDDGFTLGSSQVPTMGSPTNSSIAR